MNILWFTWKDLKHPEAGGAEVLNEEHAKRLAKDGHHVTLLVGGFKGGRHTEVINGYTVIRVGNKYNLFWEAFRYYRRHLRGWDDLVIEEINTAPFMTQWYTKNPRVIYMYQTCRKIWFHEIAFPMSIIGYVAEPLYLWLMRKNTLFTESKSTKDEAMKFGFNSKKIHIIPVGIEVSGAKRTSPEPADKFKDPTILSLGTIRSMKQTLHQIKAFEIAKQLQPNLKMKLAGAAVGAYGADVLAYLKNSPYTNDIEYLGRVDARAKKTLMSRAHLITVTSIKEGWGLIVTEAGYYGTPAVVYNADGLRDSVIHNKTGIICRHNSPEDLAHQIFALINNKKRYKIMQKNVMTYSRKFTFDSAYKEFKKYLFP